MRRFYAYTAAALLVVATIVAFTGCGAKQTASDSTASSDSLLASNPVEQPSGSITPQSDFPQQQQTTPATTEPAAKPASHHPSTRPSEKPAVAKHSGTKVEAGTALNISVDTQVSSETANVGDSWSGT